MSEKAVLKKGAKQLKEESEAEHDAVACNVCGHFHQDLHTQPISQQSSAVPIIMLKTDDAPSATTKMFLGFCDPGSCVWRDSFREEGG